MAVNIVHPIIPIRQPGNSSLCWAASIAMVLGGGATIESVRQTAVAAGRTLNPDGSMSIQNPNAVMMMAGTFRLHLRDVRMTDLTVTLLEGLMRAGRIAILGSFSYPGQASSTLHAICAFSLVGPGGGGNTRLGYVDPYRRDSASDFLDVLLDNFLTDPHFVFHR